MPIEDVKRAVSELEKAINFGEHTCDVHVEDVGDAKEVSFYLDDAIETGGDPTATLTITPAYTDTKSD